MPIIPITLRFHAVSIHRGGGEREREREEYTDACLRRSPFNIRGENVGGGSVKGLAGSLADEREFSRWGNRDVGSVEKSLDRDCGDEWRSEEDTRKRDTR